MILFIVLLCNYALLVLLRVSCGFDIIPWHMPLPFADIITITHTADCQPPTENPYLNGDCDPWGRLYNYPRIWLSLFKMLHLGSSADTLLGLMYMLVFALAVSKLAAGRSFKELLVLLLLLISPPVLLLLERGNSDLLVFTVLILAVQGIRGNRTWPEDIRMYGMLLVVFVLGMLKLYPFVLVLLLMAEPLSIRRKMLIFAGFTGLALLYLYLIWEDVMHIRTNTPAPLQLAYGRNVYLQALKGYESRELYSLMSVATVFVSAFIWSVFGCGKMHRDNTTVNHVPFRLFIAGACLYTATFLLGNNFIYRLVFLLLCLPFLMVLKRKGEFKILVNVTLLMLILRFFYHGILDKFLEFHYRYLLDIMLSWGLFYTLLVLLFICLRSSIKTEAKPYLP